MLTLIIAIALAIVFAELIVVVVAGAALFAVALAGIAAAAWAAIWVMSAAFGMVPEEAIPVLWISLITAAWLVTMWAVADRYSNLFASRRKGTAIVLAIEALGIGLLYVSSVIRSPEMLFGTFFAMVFGMACALLVPKRA